LSGKTYCVLHAVASHIPVDSTCTTFDLSLTKSAIDGHSDVPQQQCYGTDMARKRVFSIYSKTRRTVLGATVSLHRPTSYSDLQTCWNWVAV